MSNEDFAHPIEATKPIAGLAIAALFTGLGVTMIDPRAGLGVVLCCVGVALTTMLYYKNLKAMKRTRVAQWPWFGIFLILFEIAVPVYVFISRAKAEVPVADLPKIMMPVVEAPKDAPLTAANHDNLKFAKPFDCDTSFMKVDPGGKVEGFVVEGGNIKGFKKDFDIGGTMKDTKLKNFRSEAATNKPCDGRPPNNHMHIDHMYIERIGP